jgi:hypothetical protein
VQHVSCTSRRKCPRSTHAAKNLLEAPEVGRVRAQTQLLRWRLIVPRMSCASSSALCLFAHYSVAASEPGGPPAALSKASHIPPVTFHYVGAGPATADPQQGFRGLRKRALCADT